MNDLIQIGKLVKVTAKDSDGRKFSFFAKPATSSTLLGASVRVYNETDRDGAPTHAKRIIQQSLIEREQLLGLSKTYGEWIPVKNNPCQTASNVVE
jgi:hypothetical protein